MIKLLADKISLERAGSVLPFGVRVILVALAIALVSGIGVGLLASKTAENQAIVNAEQRATSDAAHISHIFYYSVWSPIRSQVGDVSFEEAVHPQIMEVFSRRSTFGLSIVELSVWSLGGNLLWSSGQSGPGAIPDGWDTATAGQATSSFHASEIVADLEGETRSTDIVRTLVPFTNAPADANAAGEVVGIIEVARDVSGETTDGVLTTALLPAGLAFVGVLGLFGLVVSVRRTQETALAQTIDLQRDRIEELEQQRVQATKLATVGETVANVAHEINNPLTAIWGLTQLLLQRDLDAPVRAELQMVHDEAERSTRIVQNLLSFARARESEKAYTSINAAVEAAVDMRRYHLLVNNVSIVVDTDPDLPRTMADPHKIQQVVLNLITNAEQALLMANGGGKIAVRTYSAESRIKLAVEDDGPGIPEEIRRRIFSPFFTTKGDGKGTGLGLSISYNIVEEHGGTIVAEALPQGGTAMTVDLPVVREKPDPGTARTLENPGADVLQHA